VWRTRTPFLVRHPWILDWLDQQRPEPALIPLEGPIRRPERGGVSGSR
jgi:glutathione S-transferase